MIGRERSIALLVDPADRSVLAFRPDPHPLEAGEGEECATFAASARSTTFIWKSVSAGCFPRIFATMPVMWGAA
jgi:hypothetical protein